MKYKSLFLAGVIVASLSFSGSVLALNLPQVQTNSASNILGDSAVLNGSISDLNGYGSAIVSFQWGTTIAYGNSTASVSQNYTGAFSRSINNLAANTSYHFRAVAQNGSGTNYGQDLTFVTPGSISAIVPAGTFSIVKTGRNLSSGNLSWSNTVYASPGDILQFVVAIQNNSSIAINNITLRDNLPAKMSFYKNLNIDGLPAQGSIVQGTNIGSLPPSQTRTVSYQVQIVPSSDFSFGTTTLSNAATAFSSDNGLTSNSASTSINITKGSVLGSATNVSTGLTNNPFVDSFFLPLIIALAGVWLFRQGLFAGLMHYLEQLKADGKNYTVEKQLKKKIIEIKTKEKI